MARLKVKQISDFTQAVGGLISAAAGDDTLSIDSLELIDSKQTVDIAANASDLTAYETDADASIDSLELIDSKQTVDIATNASGVSSANSGIGFLGSSVSSLELIDSKQTVDITALEGQTTYLKQGGLPASATQFRVNVGVKVGANDDLSVFINGLEVHPVGLLQLATADGGEYGASQVSSAEGYTVNGTGTTFTLANLGYDLEATDHVHVIGVKA